MVHVKKSAFIRFLVTGIIYLLWIIWMENLWLFVGMLLIADFYLFKNYRFLLRKLFKRFPALEYFMKEWLEALIFALIVALFLRIFIVEASDVGRRDDYKQ